MHTSGLAADRGNTVSAIFFFGAPTMIVSAAELIIMLLYEYYFILSKKNDYTVSQSDLGQKKERNHIHTHRHSRQTAAPPVTSRTRKMN
jgi:phage antirepressor YoqD-like protein